MDSLDVAKNGNVSMTDDFQSGGMQYAWHVPTYTARRASRQSGLPLAWSGKEPAQPVMTRSRSTQLVAKRIIDVVLASLAVLALAPLLLIVAMAIKFTSPGKILFRQQREGLNGQLFGTLKFRSMRTDLCDDSGVDQTRKNDPRITPIGRLIRKTSIDELPQLFNVIMGDMSLVGPRPHVAGMIAGGVPYRELVPYYAHRLDMKPGITGWAQANGLRGPTDEPSVARSRVDHDIAYCQNFSLWLDVKIMFQTVQREFISGSGH